MSRNLNDLVNITKLFGLKGLFAGLLPYGVNHLNQHWEYQFFRREDGLFLQLPKFRPYYYMREKLIEKKNSFPRFTKLLREYKSEMDELFVVRLTLKMIGNVMYSLMVGNAINILVIRM